MFKFLVIIALVACASASPLKSSIVGKIIGGTDTPINKVPYQVSLFAGKYHNCGGSIISEKYVLTANHCVIEEKPQYFHIRAGSANYNYNYTTHRVVRFITRKVDEEAADIALAEVDPPFEFDESHAAIGLYDSIKEIAPGTLALVSGWGRTLDTSSPINLQAVEVPMISKEECNLKYSGTGGISDGEICALHPDGGKDSCQGDSGGPLAVNGLLAGVVSWGIGCASKLYPGVYVDVSYYAEWIKENAELY